MKSGNTWGGGFACPRAPRFSPHLRRDHGRADLRSPGPCVRRLGLILGQNKVGDEPDGDPLRRRAG